MRFLFLVVAIVLSFIWGAYVVPALFPVEFIFQLPIALVGGFLLGMGAGALGSILE